MKKFIFMLLIMFSFSSLVYASSYRYNFKEVDKKLVLEIISDDVVISYDKAKEDFGIKDYLKLKYNGRFVYFNKGIEISELEYLKGNAKEVADDRVKLERDSISIRVHNTDEFIDAVSKIYNDKINGKYKLIYSEYEYDDFNLYKIKRFYEKNLLTDIDTNMYKFSDYGILFPTRFIPVIDKEETIINFNNAMMSDMEFSHVKEFGEYFKTLFINKSDYEKVLGVYNLIKTNSEYVSDNGYQYMNNAYLSPYDVLFERKMVCIGASTTFQYFMELLGVESYIVDRVSGINEDELYFATSHTYNVVKLDNRWYIIDIVMDKFLITKIDDYKNDTYSEYIRFGTSNYVGNGSIELDYDAINNVLDGIKGIKSEKIDDTEIKGSKDDKKEEIKEEVKEDVKVNNKDNNYLKYLLVILILIGLFIIIYISTR